MSEPAKKKQKQAAQTLFRWGIVGTGKICNDFVNAIRVFDDVRLQAVGSRILATANTFQKHFASKSISIKNAYGSYEQVMKDPEVDIIYIGTPHMFHYDNIKACLKNGKHVLCEKAFTVNAKQAREVAALAKEKNLFLMEAMWPRHFPLMYKVRELINDGMIGDLRNVTANFGFISDKSFPRLHRADCAGGALLDIGIYCLAITSMVLGNNASGVGSKIVKPVAVHAVGVLDDKFKTDNAMSLVLTYKCPEKCTCSHETTCPGRYATLNISFLAQMDEIATIQGSKGRIVIPDFHAPEQFTIQMNPYKPHKPQIVEAGAGAKMKKMREDRGFVEGSNHTFNFPIKQNQEEYMYRNSSALGFQAQEAHRCIKAGLLESPVMRVDETIAIMEIMDDIRGQVGLKYPGE